MLDLNSGKLGFFLDGVKFGEHVMLNLGDAFKELTDGNIGKVIPRTYFPVVGLRRSTDRVVLTPNWTSSVSMNSATFHLEILQRTAVTFI